MAKRPANLSPEIEAQNEEIRQSVEARGGKTATPMAIVANPLHQRVSKAVGEANRLLGIAERETELDVDQWVLWGVPAALVTLGERAFRLEQRLGAPADVTPSRDGDTRFCEWCGKPLRTVRSDAKYHPACRSAAYRGRRDGKV